MRKSMFVVPGLLALAATACAATPGSATRAAQAPSFETDQGVPTSRATTLAAKIGGPAADHAAAAAEEGAPLPTTCGAQGSLRDAALCMPSVPYARKLCGGVYPEVALGLFAKEAPFTRVYLAGDVEAWNASGGRTHRAKLAFDEEVIVLGTHGAAASGGIVMTGAQASYDVLRWDGSCVSVMEGELTAKRPPAPKPADVAFSHLEQTTRHALLEAPNVKAKHDALARACVISAAATTADKKTCHKAEKAFTLAIAAAVRGGASLPAPSRRP